MSHNADTKDQAYQNGAYVVGLDALRAAWAHEAQIFRAQARCELNIAYGDDPRATYDIFFPKDPPKGLMIYVHGGYWMQSAPSEWSHFATGAIAHGYAVAMIGYPLAPQLRLTEMPGFILDGITAAALRVDGAISLLGHSAGGQLVSRIITQGGISPMVTERLKRVIAISPISDLRPLLGLEMNGVLGLTPVEAENESPVLNSKIEGIDFRVIVGSEERPVFLDQARWLSQAWNCRQHMMPGCNHFDVLEGLREVNSPMMSFVFDR
ncbi:MAG: alpha/beta hydrolase [Litoreibacter sp.]